MFNRIHVEEWQTMAQMVGLILFLSVFILLVLRVVRMPRTRVEHLESLPLENDERTENSRN